MYIHPIITVFLWHPSSANQKCVLRHHGNIAQHFSSSRPPDRNCSEAWLWTCLSYKYRDAGVRTASLSGITVIWACHISCSNCSKWACATASFWLMVWQSVGGAIYTRPEAWRQSHQFYSPVLFYHKPEVSHCLLSLDLLHWQLFLSEKTRYHEMFSWKHYLSIY